MHVFEFDNDKSQANLVKHGIDFYDAQALWQDQDLLEVQAISKDEPRYVVISYWREALVCCYYLPRREHSYYFGKTFAQERGRVV